jgi:8-oxo-dGTP pyrophosphatase MutT (NUDIX family)
MGEKEVFTSPPNPLSVHGEGELKGVRYEVPTNLYLRLLRYKMGTMEAELKKILAARKKQYITDANRVSSAVLIPIYKKDGQYYIVFIKRTNTVKYHKGQISFPGGGRDKGDKTLLDTALREAEEEIGVKKEDIRVIGELDDQITTTSNFIVTPFIASIPYPYEFTAEKAEVEKIFSVPFKALLDKDCVKPETEMLNGKKVKSFAYYYNGTRIWGATARILNKLLDIIKEVK